jgi:hypothetical protein
MQKTALPTLAHNLPTATRNKHRSRAKMPFGPDALRLPKSFFKQLISNLAASRQSTQTQTIRQLPAALFRLIPVLELTSFHPVK